MTTYNKQLQAIFHEYEAQNGGPGPLRDAVEWGLREGRLVAPKFDPISALVQEFKGALRAEMRVDDDGREYRANAAIKFTNDGGIQESLWGDSDRASTPTAFLIESFGQRRKGIAADCTKLKDDVDHMLATRGAAYQLILDFTDDVAERQALRDPSAAAE
jgi:hypothetical protein